MDIRIKRVDTGLPLPKSAYDGDAGIDLMSALDLEIKPGQRELVPTGIAIAIPRGFAGFVQPRSGLAIKHGVSIVNTPGLIDSDYRGEIKAVLINLDPTDTFIINRGDKIAQLVIQKVESVNLIEADDLDETDRSVNGFGSSGL